MNDRPGARNLRIILREVGGILMLAGAAMGVSLLVAMACWELYTALALAISGVVTAGAGALAYFTNRAAGEPKQHHAYMIAASAWFFTALFGTLPFLLTAALTPAEVAQSFVPPGETYSSSLVHLANPLHAFFESMSAYTTTGLTMSVHEPSIGRGMLFYRSFSQWLGGSGMVVLGLVILRRPRGMSQIALYGSEATGIKLRPSVLGTVRAIWRIYLVMTLLVIVYLAIGTLILLPGYGLSRALFDAVNHGLTGVSTGGFSTLDDSIAGYGSRGMELLHIPPMILGAISIPVYYHLINRRDPRILWRDVQTRMLFLLLLFCAPVLILLLAREPAVSSPVYEGLFQFVSALTTTGWQTSRIGDWGPAAVLFIAIPFMVVGGAAGSTVGGVKLVRGYLIVRGIGWRIRRALLPKGAVVTVRLGDRALASSELTSEVADAASFTLLYVSIVALSVMLMAAVLGPEFTLGDIVFEAVSVQAGVGLSSNITSPEMPASIEVVFILQMWLGRLEIFPVLVLLRALLFGMRAR
jgi:trk system potassium uptake protein